MNKVLFLDCDRGLEIKQWLGDSRFMTDLAFGLTDEIADSVIKHLID